MVSNSSRIHKAQLLDEYNNQYTALTSIDSLYHTNRTGTKEKVPSILTGIEYISYNSATDGSSGEDFSLIYNNNSSDTEAPIDKNNDPETSILGNAKIGSISIKNFLELTYIKQQIGHIASLYINEGENPFSFNFKNYAFSDGTAQYVRDRWTGFCGNSDRAMLSWENPETSNERKHWTLIFPNDSNIPNAPEKSHIIWSNEITIGNNYKIIPWKDEVDTLINDLSTRITNYSNNQRIYSGQPPISISNNVISLNYGSGLTVSGGQLICNVSAGSTGPTYSAGNGISIDGSNKISAKLKSGGGILADSNGLYINTALLNSSSGSTYSAGNGINISNDTVSIDSGWLTMSSDNSTLQVGANKNLKCDKNIEAEHFFASSDISLKRDIHPINADNDIPVPVEFKWRNNGKKSYGFIAQELETNYPELVSESGSGDHLTVDYMSALSLVVGKLLVKINKLEERIKELEKK